MQEQSRKLAHLEAHIGQRECLWQKERDALRRENERTDEQFSEQCSILRKEAKEAERE